MADIRIEDVHLLRRTSAAVNQFAKDSARLSGEVRQAIDALRTRVTTAHRAADTEVRNLRGALLEADRSGAQTQRAGLVQRLALATERQARCRAALRAVQSEERAIVAAAWTLETSARQYGPQAIAHLEAEYAAAQSYGLGGS